MLCLFSSRFQYFSASLSPVTVLLDVYQSDATVPLTVSANWSSSTTPGRFHNTISNVSPGMRLVRHTLGTDAPATATGTLTPGSGTPLSFVTSDATVSKDSEGRLTITHR
jgi:hypothetical protein